MSGNLLPRDGEVFLVSDQETEAAALFSALIERVPWRVETVRIFGREIPTPRMTAWFGERAYAYSGITHTPEPMPPIIDAVRKRAEGLTGTSFNSVLLNYYRHGQDSMGWHSDNEACLGPEPVIASLSLGGTRRFRFRHRKTREVMTIELGSGDWLIMAGRCQACWQHAVPKTRKIVDPRVNLTFRMILD